MFDSFDSPSYFGSTDTSLEMECTQMIQEEGSFQHAGDPLRITEDECLNQLNGDKWEVIVQAAIVDSSGWVQPLESYYHNFVKPLGHCYKCIQSWKAPAEAEPKPATESSEEEKDEVEEAVSPGSSGPSTSPSADSSNGASSSGSGASRQNLPSIPVYKQPWFWSSLLVLAATGGAVYYLSRPAKR